MARNFFKNYLSENIVKHLNFNHLELVNKSYVDEKLKGFRNPAGLLLVIPEN
ncbi:MAG: Rpn family recombination-promoting nuclease/putative transposase [Desulfobacteraceae bacterium]|nr:Rpn family recombination-promoting nuclease/putative transposase [Desulfobacteraceae bacterium]